jgi:hypothetical protein
VIVDPVDPDGLLYLSEKDYRSERLVALSNDITLEVLARPTSQKDSKNEKHTTEESLNSPPFRIPISVRASKVVSSLRALFPKFSEERMVSLTAGNSRELILRWGYTLLF